MRGGQAGWLGRRQVRRGGRVVLEGGRRSARAGVARWRGAATPTRRLRSVRVRRPTVRLASLQARCWHGTAGKGRSHARERPVFPAPGNGRTPLLALRGRSARWPGLRSAAGRPPRRAWEPRPPSGAARAQTRRAGGRPIGRIAANPPSRRCDLVAGRSPAHADGGSRPIPLCRLHTHSTTGPPAIIPRTAPGHGARPSVYVTVFQTAPSIITMPTFRKMSLNS